MIYINLTSIENGKQQNELLIKTKDPHKAELVFEGALLGIRYRVPKDVRVGEIVKPNYVRVSYNDIIITLTRKEY